MKEVDLMSIGSYTELPGGNIALPQGYSSVLAPIINVSSKLLLGTRSFIDFVSEYSCR